VRRQLERIHACEKDVERKRKKKGTQGAMLVLKIPTKETQRPDTKDKKKKG
jgi:hypothetical protein